MKKLELKIAKAFLMFFGIFHLVLGVMGFFSPPLFLKLIYFIWHIKIASVTLISRFFFVYMVGSGIMILILATDIRKYRKFLIASIIAIFMEFILGVLYFQEFIEGFGVTSGFLIYNLLCLLFLTVAFIAIYFRSGR